MSRKKKADPQEKLVESATVGPKRSKQTGARDWDAHYRRGAPAWRSSGVGKIARQFLSTVAPGSSLLEVGCGFGDDATHIVGFGLQYDGIDFSRTAISQASARLKDHGANFTAVNFFSWTPPRHYAVVYDKGVFHNLAGPSRRGAFVRRVAKSLDDGGIWITVCGAAQYPGAQAAHPTIFLTHLVEAAEPYFEILKIIKGKYGVRAPDPDFDAWFGLFRRWR